MNQLHLGGCRFDTGPSLLTMPFVIDELFAEIGKKREDVLTFQPVAPLCRYFFADGSRLDAFSDRGRMDEVLRRFAPRQIEAFHGFLEYSRRIYDLTADLFIFHPIHEPALLPKRRMLKALFHLPQIDTFRTVHKAVSRYFTDPRLVQLFDRYPTYNGSDPFTAPATLNIIPHVEYTLGGYYVRGGMYRLAEALTAAAEELGVEILTGSPVEKIEHRNGRVVGVRARDTFFESDAVLCCADVVETYNRLIDGDEPYRRRLNRLEPSLSGMVFFWSVAGKHEELAHHNILFSSDYRGEFRRIFDEKQPPDEPTIYLAITSRSDPDHAPPDGENWFVLLNMPYLAPGQQWDNTVNLMRAKIFHRFKSLGIPLEERIRAEAVWTPNDFYSRFGSNRGSIYGISSNDRRMAFLRPPNRSRRLKGLFFAGGSAHPGGGVPLVIQSGRIAARLLVDSVRSRAAAI